MPKVYIVPKNMTDFDIWLYHCYVPLDKEEEDVNYIGLLGESGDKFLITSRTDSSERYIITDLGDWKDIQEIWDIFNDDKQPREILPES